MSGRSQATLVAATFALLSLVMPLVGLISSAALALVTLRKGGTEGLIISVLAAVATGLLGYLAFGSPMPSIGFALALWLPVWVLGVVLRQSRSLDLAVQLSALFGLLVLAGIHLLAPDPALYWEKLLEPVRENLVASGVFDAAAGEQLVKQASRWMTGAFAAIFYVQMLLALFLGRWWQARLYNPGGFGSEFRAFRIQPWLGYLALGFLVPLTLGDSMWAAELLLLLSPLFLFQGIAVVHGLVHASALNRGWLMGFYALLLILAPHTELLAAGLGFVDVWANFRARSGARNKS